MNYKLILRFQQGQTVVCGFTSLPDVMESLRLVSKLPLDPPLTYLELKKVGEEYAQLA